MEINELNYVCNATFLTVRPVGARPRAREDSVTIGGRCPCCKEPLDDVYGCGCGPLWLTQPQRHRTARTDDDVVVTQLHDVRATENNELRRLQPGSSRGPARYSKAVPGRPASLPDEAGPQAS